MPPEDRASLCREGDTLFEVSKLALRVKLSKPA